MTTPEAVLEAALLSYLDERRWQRPGERTTAYGRERAAASRVTEEKLDEKLHEWRRQRRQRREQSGNAR